MFGKPEWFRPKKLGWGIVPAVWQGWVYAIVWAFAIILPFVVLVERHQSVEAIIWLAITIMLLFREVREILSALRRADVADSAEATSA